MSPTLGGKLAFLGTPAQRGNHILTFLRHLPSKSAIFDLALSLQRCCKILKSCSRPAWEAKFFDVLASVGMRFACFATPLQRNGNFLPMGGPFLSKGWFVDVCAARIDLHMYWIFVSPVNMYVYLFACASLLAHLFMHPACTLK